ncbi:phosphomannomutase/phosphoglucomutase [Listeria ilorinensis]|uniref:phosphomannomutase/phosphoglucomutase n=1 Tax=Listeria ilorinensis TaxID=2867439 RepID=UPI001EF44C8B|nr:phosphomannomutase/phosphoglucomutase [Listeria ilorinensis]
MEQFDLRTLQNGSDIRGIGIETDKHALTLTNGHIQQIANGFVNWLAQKKGLSGQVKVAVGHDSRLSAERIKTALIDQLTSRGVDVLDMGLATTPAMFMATQYKEYQADAALMITASHLPYFYNGIKFFTKSGGAEHADITFMLENPEVQQEYFSGGAVETGELLATYARDLVTKIRAGIHGAADPLQPLAGSKIIVDAGNGAGGFFATEVLAELGADITGSQFLEPDGHFPHHIPNPDNNEAMASLKKAVLANGADLGVIFDTDVDRSALMDARGESYNRNPLIAMISSILLREYPGTTIVTDSTTSNHLQDFIESRGGKQHRFKRGYRNVINEAIRLNEAGTPSEIAIEISGHAALKENYFLDDGAYLVAKILMTYAELRTEGGSLQDLITDLVEPAESTEARLHIEAPDFKIYGQTVLRNLPAYVRTVPGFTLEPLNHEGVRVNTSGEFGQGWFLLRMSLHEPVMPMSIESDEPGGVRKIKQALQPFFAQYEELIQRSSIYKFLRSCYLKNKRS